jgi:hypothetical protein
MTHIESRALTEDCLPRRPLRGSAAGLLGGLLRKLRPAAKGEDPQADEIDDRYECEDRPPPTSSCSV